MYNDRGQQLGGRDPEHPHVPSDNPGDTPAGYRPEDEDPATPSPGSIERTAPPYFRREIVPALKNAVGTDLGRLTEGGPQPHEQYVQDERPDDAPLKEEDQEGDIAEEADRDPADLEQVEKQFLRELG